jgi:hypothetical protein
VPVQVGQDLEVRAVAEELVHSGGDARPVSMAIVIHGNDSSSYQVPLAETEITQGLGFRVTAVDMNEPESLVARK